MTILKNFNMDYYEKLLANKNKGRSLLFRCDDLFLVQLNELILEQDRQTIILWAFDISEKTMYYLTDKYLDDRPKIAYETVKLWSKGEIKMMEAKRAILDLHAMAKEVEEKHDELLIHALGQALSCVHTPKHAMGYPIYALSAAVYHGASLEELEYMKNRYINKLLYYKDIDKTKITKWASFISKY